MSMNEYDIHDSGKAHRPCLNAYQFPNPEQTSSTPKSSRMHNDDIPSKHFSFTQTNLYPEKRVPETTSISTASFGFTFKP